MLRGMENSLGSEELNAVVRARLEQMVALARASTDSWLEDRWYDRRDLEMDIGQHDHTDAAYIAAANPALLLRIAKEALRVLHRHQQHQVTCGNDVTWRVVNVCPEVAAVIWAWQP